MFVPNRNKHLHEYIGSIEEDVEYLRKRLFEIIGILDPEENVNHEQSQEKTTKK